MDVKELVSNECKELTEAQKISAYHYALSAGNEEWCGVITRTGTVKPMTNCATNKERAWMFDHKEWAEIENDAVALIHSHVAKELGAIDVRTPSRADIACVYSLMLPMFIVGKIGNICFPVVRIPSIPHKSYVGRSYIYAVQDCGVLIRDYYLHELGIALDLNPMDSLCDRKDQSGVALSVLARNGFVEGDVHYFKKGDIFLISRNGQRRNHAVLCIDNEYCIDQAEISQKWPISHFINDIVGGVWRLPI